MFKLTSTSNSPLSFQVVENGNFKAVRLTPKAFCFTETLTDQIRNLQALRVLRIKEVPAPAQKAAQPAPTQTTVTQRNTKAK